MNFKTVVLVLFLIPFSFAVTTITCTPKIDSQGNWDYVTWTFGDAVQYPSGVSIWLRPKGVNWDMINNNGMVLQANVYWWLQSSNPTDGSSENKNIGVFNEGETGQFVIYPSTTFKSLKVIPSLALYHINYAKIRVCETTGPCFEKECESNVPQTDCRTTGCSSDKECKEKDGTYQCVEKITDCRTTGCNQNEQCTQKNGVYQCILKNTNNNIVCAQTFDAQGNWDKVLFISENAVTSPYSITTRFQVGDIEGGSSSNPHCSLDTLWWNQNSFFDGIPSGADELETVCHQENELKEVSFPSSVLQSDTSFKAIGINPLFKECHIKSAEIEICESNSACFSIQCSSSPQDCRTTGCSGGTDCEKNTNNGFEIYECREPQPDCRTTGCSSDRECKEINGMYQCVLKSANSLQCHGPSGSPADENYLTFTPEKIMPALSTINFCYQLKNAKVKVINGAYEIIDYGVRFVWEDENGIKHGLTSADEKVISEEITETPQCTKLQLETSIKKIYVTPTNCEITYAKMEINHYSSDAPEFDESETIKAECGTLSSDCRTGGCPSGEYCWESLDGLFRCFKGGVSVENASANVFYIDNKGEKHESFPDNKLTIKEGQLVVLDPSHAGIGDTSFPPIVEVKWYDTWEGEIYELHPIETSEWDLSRYNAEEGGWKYDSNILTWWDIKKQDLPFPDSESYTWALIRSFAPGIHIIEMVAKRADGSEVRDMISLDVKEVSSTSQHNIGVFLVKFRDKDTRHDRKRWDAYEYHNVVASMVNNYLEEASDGRVRFNFKVFDNNQQWYTLKNLGDYCGPYLEFVRLGTDLKFWLADYGSSYEREWNDHDYRTILVHASPVDFECLRSGHDSVTGMIVVSEAGTGMDSVGTWAHELLHSLGAEDRYEGKGLNDVPGVCLMGSGNEEGDGWQPVYPSIEQKEQLGWTTGSAELEGGKEYTLNAWPTDRKIFEWVLQKTLILSLPVQWLIIEPRTNEPEHTYWDRALRYPGVNIYRRSPDVFGEYIVWDGNLINPGDHFYYPSFKADVQLINSFVDFTGSNDIVSYVVAGSRSTTLKGAYLYPMNNMIYEISEASINRYVPDQFSTYPDLDLHAYYTKPGSNTVYHVGMNYQTGEYEKQEGIESSRDSSSEEWIFLPPEYSVEFKVVNNDVKQFFQTYPWAADYSDGAAKYYIQLSSYTSTETNASKLSLYEIKLSESEKAYTFENTQLSENKMSSPYENSSNKFKVWVVANRQKESDPVFVKSKEVGPDDKFGFNDYNLTEAAEYVLFKQSPGPDGIYFDKTDLFNQINGTHLFFDQGKAQSDDIFAVEDVSAIIHEEVIEPKCEEFLCENKMMIAGAVMILIVFALFELKIKSKKYLSNI